MLFVSTKIEESYEKVKIVKLASDLRQSKYVDDFYVYKKFIDEQGRIMVATGRWVNNLKEDDEINGIVQKRKYADEDGLEYCSYYFENPYKKKCS